MLRRLECAGVGPVPGLSVDLGSRLNVFAGDNGLGKSFVLEVLWWALTLTLRIDFPNAFGASDDYESEPAVARLRTWLPVAVPMWLAAAVMVFYTAFVFGCGQRSATTAIARCSGAANNGVWSSHPQSRS